MPIKLEHDTDTLDCWCQPSYYVACPTCDGRIAVEGKDSDENVVHMHDVSTCRRDACADCAGGRYLGLLWVDRVTAALRSDTVLVVHNENVN